METIKINKPENFSFSEALWFLDRNLDDCTHSVVGESALKLVRFNNKAALIRVEETGNFITAKILKGKINDPTFLPTYLEEWFDISRDLRPFYSLLKKDKDLAPLAGKYKGFHIVGIPDFFETLCWSVIGQQINLAFAFKVKRRLVESYGEKLIYEGRTHFLFPTAEIIAKLNVEDLRPLQFTTRKAEYIIGIAQLFESGDLSRKKIEDLKDEQAMLTELMKIRGIGEWTANYTLMKSFRAMNRVPYGDSGINNGLFNLKGIPKKDNRLLVESVFDKFTGWKSYLVYYLWRSLRNPAVQ
jgi:DNA-3-methyladenine glycosylase II